MDRSEYFHEPDALVTAVLLCDIEAARELISKGADINAKDDMGTSALIMSIEEDWYGTEWIELLLKSGANANQPDDDGDTPLDIAKYKGREDIVAVLLDHGGKGKVGPSAKEIRDDQVHDAFQNANAVKKLVSEMKKKL